MVRMEITDGLLLLLAPLMVYLLRVTPTDAGGHGLHQESWSSSGWIIKKQQRPLVLGSTPTSGSRAAMN